MAPKATRGARGAARPHRGDGRRAMTQDIARWALTLTEAVEAIAERRLTARALADAQLARIAATDAAIDAWAALDPRTCAPRRAMRRGAAGRGALDGIGIGVKDIIATADLPTTDGLADLRGPSSRAGRGVRRAAEGERRVRVRQDGDDASSRSWTRARRAIRGTRRARRAARRPDRRPRWPSGTWRARSARRPTARSCGRRRTAASSASSPRCTRSRTPACTSSARRSTRSARSRAPWTTPRAWRARSPIPAASPGRSRRCREPPRLAYLGDFPWTVVDCDARRGASRPR